MTIVTRQQALEALDDWAAEDPLDALRSYPEYLTPYRLDACAIAEPAAAMVHAWHLLTPERQAYCIEAAREVDLHRFIPDRLAPERRKAIEMVREFGHWKPSLGSPARNGPPGVTVLPPRICNGCGGPLPGGRSDAKFCSNACRQRSYRQRRAAP
jgi:hypothetical protein